MSSQVSVYLDESAMNVCMVHQPCEARGSKPGPNCDRRYIYGVGAAVFELGIDAEGFRDRLDHIWTRIRARSGISTSTRMTTFAIDGWHATEDLPEFADPLIEEIDTDGVFKGHVRYIVSEVPAENVDDLYDTLFVWLLRSLFQRYPRQELSVVFEVSGKSLADIRKLVDSAGAPNGTTVGIQGKGDHLLALADYLLFASLKYAGRTEQLCNSNPCALDHRPPIATDLRFDGKGSPLPTGHVGPEDRWHKLYYAFVRNMSSAVKGSSQPVSQEAGRP